MAENRPVLQGFVYNHERKPVPGATVTIKDSMTGEIYGNATTDERGYWRAVLSEKAVGKHIDLYWEKNNCKRDEMGYLIPKKDFVSRAIYTYMTVELNEKTVTAFVYDYPSGEPVKDVTLIVEDAKTLDILARAKTDSHGTATFLVPANSEINIWANPEHERRDILGGQELGISMRTNCIVTIYVETL